MQDNEDNPDKEIAEDPIRRHIGDRQSLGVFAALRGVHRGIQEHDEQKHLEGGLPFLCYSP